MGNSTRSILEYLETFCDELTPREFLRTIFPEGELEAKGEYVTGKYTAIAVAIPQNPAESGKKARTKRYTITDDLDMIDELCTGDDFCLMSPISYAGKSRKSENARFLYALAVDLDGIRMRESEDRWPSGMVDLFWQMDGNGPSNYLPKPTMIVASGTGLHIYYVFERPIALFPNVVPQLERYKRRLTWQLWTQGVSDLQDTVQYESLFQGFRIPGTVTKNGKRARAFLVDQGVKVTMEYMNRFVPEEYRTETFAYKSKLTLAEAKVKYPEWYEKRIVEKRPKETWQASPAVYEWWKKQIVRGAEDGHRYWCVMALAAYAKKCGVPREKLEEDAFGMIDMLHSRGKRADNPFTADDVLAALEAYNDSYITYPIDTISARTGIHIKKNLRRYRKQNMHLQIARGNKAILKRAGEMKPEGRPPKDQLVRDWRAAHPEGRKADCIRDTGLDKKTVYRWWDPEVTAETLRAERENARREKELVQEPKTHEKTKEPEILYDAVVVPGITNPNDNADIQRMLKQMLARGVQGNNWLYKLYQTAKEEALKEVKKNNKETKTDNGEMSK